MKTKITHSELVRRLKKPGWKISNRLAWDWAASDLIHMNLGLSGEVGELLDAIKKHAIYEQQLDLKNVIEELGDIEFFLEGLRQRLSITRQTTIQGNINKLTKRYGSKYSDKKAKERRDKR